ncbi:MAG: hypothetical protein GXY86_16300 [Firmicutes bacterium]|jgi:hypothetical protein|nr:hypothetical protein [Bacillota bacterium]
MSIRIKYLRRQIKGTILLQLIISLSSIFILGAFIFGNSKYALIIIFFILFSVVSSNQAWKKAYDPLYYLISNLLKFSTLYLLIIFIPVMWPSFFTDKLWYRFTIFITSLNILFIMINEHFSWPRRIIEWEKVGKINFSKGEFNVLASWRDMSQKDKKAINIGFKVIPIIAGIFVLLTERLEDGIQIALIKIVIMFLGLLFGTAVGQYFIWVIKIRKLQRNGANLRTEYSRIMKNSV